MERLRPLHPRRPDAAAARLPARLARRGRHLGRFLLVPHARESQDGLRARGRARDPRGRRPHRLRSSLGPSRRRVRRAARTRRLFFRHLGGAADLAVHHARSTVADRDRGSAGRCAVGRARHRDDGSVDRPGAATWPSLLPGDVRHRRRARLRIHVGAGRTRGLHAGDAGARPRLDMARRARALSVVGARPRRRRPSGDADRRAGGAQCPRTRRGGDRNAGESVDAMPRGPAAVVVSEGRA